ncbi:cell death abnormality protein 1-like [Physella acuta]|uniref:cell death abnormality protein 1-like n=1 Tax=Physella acuta TaxID=109671 RepID=UPI0027DE1EB4|nr:cell death abnormality protein 1-like [Physella acuta]
MCSSRCKDSKCNPVNGTCLSCNAGYTGADCLTHCPGRAYGLNCKGRCSENCAVDGRCDPANGTCLHGCVAGYQGDNCSQTCIEGYYGQNCAQSCSSWCLKQLCNHVTGECHVCVEGKAGPKCTYDQGHSAIKLKYIGTGVGIGVATSSFVFLLVITVVYFLKRVKCIGNKTTNNDSSIEKKEKAETVNLKDVKIVESVTTEQDSADVYHNEITNMYDVIGSRGFEKQHSSDYMKY